MKAMSARAAVRRPFDCERWAAVPANTSPEARAGTHDRYSAPIPGVQDEDAADVFARARLALMR
jgi:hypothetical protein